MDIYTIIFLALAVFIFLRLRSVLGQRTGSERPFRVSAFAYRLSMIAAVLCAVIGGGHIAASTTAAPIISGPARVIDGDTVFVVGILFTMALLLGAALVLSFLHWKDWKARKPGQGAAVAPPDPIEVTARPHPHRVYLKKAKPLDGLLRDHPSQRKADDPWLPHQKADRVDPRIEREFNNVFMTTSKEGKQAPIERWIDRKKAAAAPNAAAPTAAAPTP